MYEIGVETVGQGALKPTGFLKELMQRRNISCESLYTVRAIKEVKFVYAAMLKLFGVQTFLLSISLISTDKLIVFRMKLIFWLLTLPLFLSHVKKLCYVAADYEAELRKDTQASCEVDGEGWFTLSEERFKTPEILFQPHMGGMYGIFRYCLICAFITV